MVMKLLIVLFWFELAIRVASNEAAPRVKTPLGGLKGYYKISQDGRQYEAYEGIPYALPPVGELRFEPPQPIPAWTGEISATTFGSPCLQCNKLPKEYPNKKNIVEGAEDCLYLNIYVPVRTGNKTPLPVLFWIHGGAFQFGSGMLYGAKYLMDRDVIFVTINYRLGPFGFLSTEDDVVPGNMGLKDQNMALCWVSENIEWFGGNPKKITLVGMSAGGISVHYHYLSRMSAGLFQGGISVSGTAFNCWAQTENAQEKAKKLSALMGCPTDNSRDMIRCLRHRPGRAIAQTESNFMSFMYNPFTSFGPVLERIGNTTPFIDRTPVEIVSSGDVQDVPWITGVVSEEGIYLVAEFIDNDKVFKELNDNWDVLGPEFLHFNYTIPREKHVETARLIKQHYLGTKPINSRSTKKLIQIMGDRFFVVDNEKAARLQAKVNQNPVWYYYYSYNGGKHLRTPTFASLIDERHGVCHGDDVFLVVDSPYIQPLTTRKNRDMQQHWLNFWVSFATDGVPKISNVEWPRLDPNKKDFHYLHFASPSQIYMDSNANLGEKTFWNSIKFNENVANNAGKSEL